MNITGLLRMFGPQGAVVSSFLNDTAFSGSNPKTKTDTQVPYSSTTLLHAFSSPVPYACTLPEVHIDNIGMRIGREVVWS